MADRTFIVTVAYADGGNKYFLDGVQQATVNLVEGGTFRFDQSDDSNGNHPLRFSTTSNGTHSGGSEYTTNVTTNGTPGSSGAYTEIQVASSAPTLYYYCTNHSNMGGQANTPSVDVWGAGNWSANLWGISEAFTVGYGAKNWNSSGSWGDMGDETITPTGFGLTSSLGSVSITTEINSGWGRQPWDQNAWGIQGIVLLDGQSATASVGSLSPADVMGLTGVSSTASVGSPTIIGDITAALTGQAATTSVGSITPADVMGLTGVSSTASVGSISPADVIGLTGFSATISLGTTNINSNPTINVSGLSATSAVGSLTPADVMGLTGVSATSAVGSLTPADVMGLTGVSATASVAGFGISTGFGIQAYQDVDTGVNITYSNVA
jgi:uncharacterized ParB-like nuclease family protein